MQIIRVIKRMQPVIFKRLMDAVSFRLIPWLTGQNYAPDVYITNAFYLNWRHLSGSMRLAVPYVGGRCVDVGAGTAPYQKLVSPYTSEYIVADYADTRKSMFAREEGVFVEADAMNLPFESATMDTVLLTQVLEHVADPKKALGEARRILREEGVLIISVPFIYQAHAEPYDFWRFSEYGLRHLIAEEGFEIAEFHYQGYIGTALVSIWNGFLWQAASRYKPLRNTVFLPFLLITFVFNNGIGRMLDCIKISSYSPNFFVICKKKLHG